MIDKRRFLSNFISGIKRTTTSDCKSAFVCFCFRCGRQTGIHRIGCGSTAYYPIVRRCNERLKYNACPGSSRQV